MRLSRLPPIGRPVDYCDVNVRQLPALTVVLAAAALLAAFATLAIFSAVLGRIVTNAYGATGDFLDFYAAGYLARTGQSAHLYDPEVIEATQRFLYPGGFDEAIGFPFPVFVAWLFAPVSRLPFTAAYLLYMAFTAALLIGVLLVLDRQLHAVPKPARWLFLACGALALPSLATVVFGQVDLIVLAGLLGGYLLLRADRRALAGLSLCLVLVKPHLLLGVALLLLLRRDWKTMGVLAAAGLPLLILPLLLAGPATLADYARELIADPGAGRELTVNGDVMPNWRGFIVSATNSERLIFWVPGALAIAAGATALALSRWRRAAGAAAFDRDYSLAVLLPLLVSPHLHSQSLAVALLPAALALRAYLGPNASAGRQARAANAVLLTYTLLFALPFLATQGLSLTVFLIAGGYAALALRWPGLDAAGARNAVAKAESAPARARAA